MAEKKKFLLRIDDKVYAALEKWAADDLRSINSQIEYLLTDALKKSSRNILSSQETKQTTRAPLPKTNSPSIRKRLKITEYFTISVFHEV